MSDYDDMMAQLRKRGRWKEYTATIVMSLVIIVVLAAVFTRGACADSQDAVRAVEIQGFTDVKVEAHDWFAVGFRGCSSHDAAKFAVTATNVRNQRVTLLVCSGWPFKGFTVRSE